MRNIILLLFFFAQNSFASFAVIGDAGKRNSFQELVKHSIIDGRIKHLILPGDNLYDQEDEYYNVWNHWLRQDLPFSIVALGNHYKSIESEKEYFKLTSTYYSKIIDEVHFFVLDSEQEHLVGIQKNWLINELKRVNEKDLVVIVFHHPPVSLTSRHHWQEKKEFHKKILPLILNLKSKIDLVLVGHDHINSLFTINNIPFVVSGATMEVKRGNVLDYVDEKRSLVVETKWLFNNKDPYWTRLDFNTQKEDIWLNFINAKTKQVECSARLRNHLIFKRFNCKKKHRK